MTTSSENPAGATIMQPTTDRELVYQIRPLIGTDQALLREMLYISLFVREGDQPFTREIVDTPEISRYVAGWGRAGDTGFVAVDEDGRALGAIWLRLFTNEERGFGWIDEDTPELGLAVVAPRRGEGIGTALLNALLNQAGGTYDRISLSVSRDNPAIRLYGRFGFETVGDDGSSLTMVKSLGRSHS